MSTETKATHSPLPWRVQVNPSNDVTYILSADAVMNDFTGGMEQPIYGNDGNAEFIVRACNAHDELLAALKHLSAEAHGFLSMADAENHGHTNMMCLQRRIEEARSAIAKAEGR